jgi:hypothetical protein
MRAKLRALGRRIVVTVVRFSRARPAIALTVGCAGPWLLYANTDPTLGAWAAATDLYLLVPATIGLLAAVGMRGVRDRDWPLVVGAYTAAMNIIVAEFAYLHYTLSTASPQAFTEPMSRIDAAYFAWVTAATSGFGDIAARSDAARIAVTAQTAVTLAVIVAGLAIVTGAAPRVAPGAPTNTGASPGT